MLGNREAVMMAGLGERTFVTFVSSLKMRAFWVAMMSLSSKEISDLTDETFGCEKIVKADGCNHTALPSWVFIIS